MTMGMCAVSGCWRIAAQAERPSRFGMTTSSSTTSGCSLRAFSIASRPSRAVTTVNGPLARIIFSTNADRPGFSPSESIAGPNLEALFGRCQGRIVVTCFASNIHRVQQVVDAAAAHGRKVVLVGRSMRKNINIGRMLGHIDVPDGMIVGPREASDFPDHKLVIDDH